MTTQLRVFLAAGVLIAWCCRPEPAAAIELAMADSEGALQAIPDKPVTNDTDSHACELPSCVDEHETVWHCTAGVEATFLVPLFRNSSNPALGLNGRDYTNIENVEAAPRLWIGVENDCGRGIRARYWHLDAEDGYTGLEFDLPNFTNITTVNAWQTLEAYTVDVEFTRRWEKETWDLLGSFGVRFANLSREEGFSAFSQGNFNGFTSADFDFNGTGLTFALEGRRPMSEGFSLIANARGSVMWGQSRQNGSSMLDTIPSTGLQFALIEDDNTLGIFEAQVGGEWSKYLDCCAGTVFVRAMFEYQYWTVDELNFALDQNLNGTALSVGNLSPDVDFLGFTFAVGFSR